jgi:hypothetical protein
MGRAKGDVKNEENEYFKMVIIQWWVHVKKASNYEDCWNGKWKCNLANPKQWLDILIIKKNLFP